MKLLLKLGSKMSTLDIIDPTILESDTIDYVDYNIVISGLGEVKLQASVDPTILEDDIINNETSHIDTNQVLFCFQLFAVFVEIRENYRNMILI